MKLFSVAIGAQYEKEAERLQACVSNVEVFTKNSSLYQEVNSDPLINGLWHKTNFANYILEEVNGPVVFLDADIFTLTQDPFSTFSVAEDTDIAYVPYPGIWYLPDEIRQNAFNFHGHKINSGFIYFRTLDIAKAVCNQWQFEYLEREKLYDESKGTSKHEYDEWALMIALSKLQYKVELLDKKWNHWQLNSEEEIKSSDSIFFQSHFFID